MSSFDHLEKVLEPYKGTKLTRFRILTILSRLYVKSLHIQISSFLYFNIAFIFLFSALFAVSQNYLLPALVIIIWFSVAAYFPIRISSDLWTGKLDGFEYK